ncbi:MAG: dihydroxy-acid dehydratase, partial [Dermabacteraceae bacterium]
TCALITDGRFSGGTSGVSLGHISPEAAEGGLIGLIEDGDTIVIDVDKRLLELDVPEEEIERRRTAKGPLPWRPEHREREVSQSLKVYAHMVRSATYGATRRPLD